MKNEYDFSKGKLKKSAVLKEKDTKIQTSIRLDADVMKWLQTEAAKLGVPYQTFINIDLRTLMKKQNIESRLEVLEKKLKVG